MRAIRCLLPVLLGFATMVAIAQTESGPFDSTKVRLLTSPEDTRYYANAYNRPRMMAWDEQQSIALPRALKVDIVRPGLYRALQDLGTYFIPEGTAVSSSYFYFDPKSSHTMDTTVRFQHRILGVIVCSERLGDDRLLESDWLALPSVPAANFPKGHFKDRGLEMPLDHKRAYGREDDGIEVGENAITVHLSASNPGDQIRVITEG